MAGVEGVMGVPRRERPLESADTALLRFAADLRRLREKAGNPTYRELSRRAHYSAATLSEAAGGRKLPSLAVTVAYVTACGDDPANWRARWQAVIGESDAVAVNRAGPDEKADQSAPYVGLAAFQPADAEWFFGRDIVIKDLLAKVRERRFLGVFGASGSGKSSVLRAGLVATARTNGLLGSGPLPTVVFTPGPHPLEECAVQLASYTGEPVAALRNELAADPQNLHLRIRQVLTKRSAEIDLVLVIDQFEEVFTLCHDAKERERFIAALVFAATTATSRVRVVLGVRADFYGHCGQHPELVEALRDGQILVGSMATDELREAITGPAAAAGAMVESALVTRLLTDATGQPGVLPLVSHALLETWRRRRGATLTLAGYEAAGGIQHAIARSAEHIHITLTAAQQAVAKQIFLRLTALGEATEDTKRRVHRRELDNDDPDTLVVLEKLTCARLVVVDHDNVEIAHEALIRCWPRLHDWLTEDREGLKIHRQLTNATDAWEAVDLDPGALYRDTRLALAREWADRGGVLTSREGRFLQASVAEEDTQKSTARRRTRRLKQAVILLTAFVLLLTGTVFYAVATRRNAVEQRNMAMSLKAAAEAMSLARTQPVIAAKLSLAAYHFAPTPQARDALFTASTVNHGIMIAIPESTDYTSYLAPDGNVALVERPGEPTQLWSISSSIARPHARIPVRDVNSVEFSADADLMAVTDLTSEQTHLWDIADLDHPHHLSTFTSTSFVLSINSKSNIVAGVELLKTSSNSDPRLNWESGRAVVWDITDRLHPQELPLPGDSVDFVRLSWDGRDLVTRRTEGPGSVTVMEMWHLTDQREFRKLWAIRGDGKWGSLVTYSQNGQLIAFSNPGLNAAEIWDISVVGSPKKRGTITGVPNLTKLLFSGDTTTLVGEMTGGAIRIWNIKDPDSPHLEGSIPELGTPRRVLQYQTESHAFIIVPYISQSAIWRLDPHMSSIVSMMCQDRELRLTDDEWRQYFPGISRITYC
jgi:hypothetical protein